MNTSPQSQNTTVQSWFVSSFIITIVTIYSLTSTFLLVVNAQAVPSSFIFTAVGDYGASDDTTSVLQGIANSGADFNLALGDLSYDERTPESAWCDYVKSNVGQTFPFELIAGNHEDYNTTSADGTGGNIDNFTPCLPDRIGTITGTYAKEYYFDYPVGAPLARFIQISPNIQMADEYWQYTLETTHYDWLANAIDTAHQAGIKWVIVDMHEAHISMGEVGDSIGTPVWDLMVNKKVDLVLHGHDHNYQRGKQLAINNTTCTSIPSGSYNSNCIIDNGADRGYVKDQGTVFMIVGTGGSPHHNINLADPEAQYFATWMGGNINPTKGYMKFQVSETELRGDFVRTVGGTFYDYFTINNTGTAMTPTPTLVPTATPTSTTLPASGTIVLTPIADTFNDQNTPNINYGFQTYLKANGNPTQNAFMKFDLKAIVGKTINTAKLGITTTGDTFAGTTGTSTVKLVASTDWSERYMTYNNTVAISTIVLGSLRSIAANTYAEIPLDKTQLQPKVGGLLSIAIVAIVADDMVFSSREANTGNPQLIIDYTGASTPTNTPTPAPTTTPTQTPIPTATLTPSPLPQSGTAVINAYADTYIDRANPNTPYGFGLALSVDGNPINKTFIRFDLTALAGKTFQTVKLRVKTASNSNAGSKGAQTVKFVQANDWSEQGMTYNNAVPISATVLGSVVPTTKSNTSYDVTLDKTFLQQYVGKLISVAIESTSNDEFIIMSRESGIAPQLIITY